MVPLTAGIITKERRAVSALQTSLLLLRVAMAEDTLNAEMNQQDSLI